jgi:hypothetical protein
MDLISCELLETVQKFKIENPLEVSHFNSFALLRNYYKHQCGGVGIYLFIYFFVITVGPTQSAVLCILGVFPWGKTAGL